MYYCTTLSNDDVSWRHQNACYRGVSEKRNPKVYFAAAVASKFARFKSGLLQRVEHTAIESVQNTHHWSRRPQTSHQNQNRVGLAASRHHCCSYASVASPSFSLCEGRQWSFRALLLILTLCFCDNCGLWSLRSLVESNSWYSGVIFLQLSVMALCVLMHNDRWIHKVK